MEIGEPLSFDSLFGEIRDLEETESLLPLIKECIANSKEEAEVVRAVEIAFCYSVKNIPASQLEDNLFSYACPAAKNIVTNKLKSLEGESTVSGTLETCVQSLDTCLAILNHFLRIFDHLNEFEKFTMAQVGTLLLNSSEVVYNCFFHCKISEQVYGGLFTSVTEHLSNFFKKCCSLQEELLNFLSGKLDCESSEDEEWKILNEILIFLSKTGVVLINLEVKTMAKVWKAYALFLDKYFSFLKNEHRIGETINELCLNIKNSLETLLSKNEEHDGKIIKLCCFLLKLIIRFCEIFNGCLRECQKSLLSLLLLLSRCAVSSDGNLIKQLTTGSDPLLSQLLSDEMFVKECGLVSKDDQFCLLCCSVLRKLMQANSQMRCLWLNESENALQWMFTAASFSQFIISSNVHLPSVITEGKQRKFSDLYEYVLVTMSAYLMTTTADEFPLVENTLLESVLQPNPIRALLAIDAWCLLARFGNPELCFLQIMHLSKIFQEFEEGTVRVEKLYLGSLLRRLFLLLTRTQKGVFLKSFRPSLYAALWAGYECSDFDQSETEIIISAISTKLDQFLNLPSFSSLQFEENMRGFPKLEWKLMKLWRFNCQMLSSHPLSIKLFKVACVVASSLVARLPPEDLFLILSQMRKLLAIGQPTSVQLYFTLILDSLSAVEIPAGSHQRNALTAMADVFRELLSSKQILVKQKTLETFYSFSHVTTHGEVIPLCVHDSPKLKLEITNYFKKKYPEEADFSLGEYLGELYRLRFQHVCRKRQDDEGRLNAKRMRTDPGDFQEVISRWKEDGERIRECFQSLTESQKREVRDLCSFIASSARG